MSVRSSRRSSVGTTSESVAAEDITSYLSPSHNYDTRYRTWVDKYSPVGSVNASRIDEEEVRSASKSTITASFDAVAAAKPSPKKGGAWKGVLFVGFVLFLAVVLRGSSSTRTTIDVLDKEAALPTLESASSSAFQSQASELQAEVVVSGNNNDTTVVSTTTTNNETQAVPSHAAFDEAAVLEAIQEKVDAQVRQRMTELETRLREQLQNSVQNLKRTTTTSSSSSSSAAVAAASDERIQFLLDEVSKLRASFDSQKIEITQVESFGKSLSSRLNSITKAKTSEGDVLAQKIKDLEKDLAAFAKQVEDLREQATSNEWKNEVNALVSQKITRFSADFLGEVDYALEQTGGLVVSHSSTSNPCSLKSSVAESMSCRWNVFLYPPPQTLPETAIRASSSIGNCWAMQGPSGYLTVQLTTPIFVSSVTIDHVHKSVATKIDSAPKDFRIFGVTVDGDEILLLNEVSYKIYDSAEQTELPQIQNFPVMKTESPVTRVRLEILNNYGNLDFTCLYRFRVHGKPL